MDSSILVIIAIAGLAGCLLLLVIGLTWKPASKAGKAAAPAELEAAAPAQAVSQSLAQDGAREVLRVLRDAKTEALMLEVAGKRFEKMADIQPAEMRAGVLTTLRDLGAFANGGASVPAAALPLVLDPAVAAAAGVNPVPQPAPLPAPSMNPIKQMRVLRELAKTPPPAPKTITEQIDEILQEKLAGTPHVKRGIRVLSGPKGNALFSADGQEYEAVDSVPDDEVRTLIRTAVAEWERKQ